jgi:hypothetical protein
MSKDVVGSQADRETSRLVSTGVESNRRRKDSRLEPRRPQNPSFSLPSLRIVRAPSLSLSSPLFQGSIAKPSEDQTSER